MIINIIIVLTLVYHISAHSSFIGEGKRAKLFELLDDEVGTFRITIPDEDFSRIKAETQVNIEDQFALVGNSKINSDGSLDTSNMVDSLEEYKFKKIKTKKASLTVKINGVEKSFEKVTFSLGGCSSHVFGKQAYNIKIRGDQDLFGRSQFRIRPDAREPTFLRSKLVCDIHNRLGIDSISAGFITLYINDQYMGLYVLMDSIKLSWIKYKYNDDNTQNLYQCKKENNFLTLESSSTGCTNENDDVKDNNEWIEFLTALENAQTADDLESIFDIDQFLYEMAFEYLSGSWDHFLYLGHNFNLYKQKNGKWKFYLYDFDAEFGQETVYGVSGLGLNSSTNKDLSTYSFKEWARPNHLLDVLIFNNSTRFDNILKNIVTDVFNPATLFPYIDELKDFIRPYIEIDKTPNEDGKYPGRINEKTKVDYSIEEWEASSEFTSIKTTQYGKSIGLKYWILTKYRYVCEAYNIQCDPVYTDKNYKFSVNEKLQVENDFNIPPPVMEKIVNNLLKNNPEELVNKLLSLLQDIIN